MKVKKILTYVGVLSAGIGIGVLGSYKYFEKQYDEKIREYYTAFSKENFEEYLVKHEPKVEDEKIPEVKTPKTTVTFSSSERKEDLKEYKQMANGYSSEPFDYAGLSRPHIEDPDLTVDDSPREDDDYFTEEHDPNNIIPIDANMWESATGYDKIYVNYFKDDDVFANEETGVELIPEETCGREVLNRLGDEVPNMAYSRNVDNGEEYAVFRYFGSYKEEHA